MWNLWILILVSLIAVVLLYVAWNKVYKAMYFDKRKHPYTVYYENKKLGTPMKVKVLVERPE